MTNLLPFLMYRGTISFIKNLPVMMHDIKNKYEEHKERKRLEKEELEEAEVIEESKKSGFISCFEFPLLLNLH